jgi:thiol-disulfide isomerase/thioredoxin
MRNAIYMCIAVILLGGCGVAENLISTPVSNAVVKNTNGTEMLLGHCTRSCLMQKPFSDWFTKNYDDYKVDSSLTKEIGKLMKNKNITIFLGSWCGDSRREVPRMLKILDAAGIKEKQYDIIFVSNEAGLYKQSPQHEEKGKNIKRVPTFIISEVRNEKARIIEYPKESLEKDLLKILQGKVYVPNHAAL